MFKIILKGILSAGFIGILQGCAQIEAIQDSFTPLGRTYPYPSLHSVPDREEIPSSSDTSKDLQELSTDQAEGRLIQTETLKRSSAL